MSDSNTKNIGKGKFPFIIGISIVLILVILRFAFYYFRSDGFNGISILLPVFLIGFILFALASESFFAAWVYQDCKKRNDDGVLWAFVIFIATPFIGLLIYFLRRSEVKNPCPACGHWISIKAKYCEECGSHMENKENPIMEKQHTHHLYYIIAGIVSIVLMLTCLAGFIAAAATEGNVNTSVTSDEKIWNFGGISMNYNTYIGGVWKLNFKSASDGFVSEENFEIQDADTEKLYADIICGTVPEGASLTLWIVQGETSASVDVTKLSEPLEYALNAFENGTIHVRLQINGVEDAVSQISIK